MHKLKNNLILIIAILFSMIFIDYSYSNNLEQTRTAANRPILAISKFKSINTPDYIALAITEAITNYIVSANKYHITERSHLEEILPEHHLTSNDLFETSNIYRYYYQNFTLDYFYISLAHILRYRQLFFFAGGYLGLIIDKKCEASITRLQQSPPVLLSTETYNIEKKYLNNPDYWTFVRRRIYIIIFSK